jgi:hypothetical protein
LSSEPTIGAVSVSDHHGLIWVELRPYTLHNRSSHGRMRFSSKKCFAPCRRLNGGENRTSTGRFASCSRKRSVRICPDEACTAAYRSSGSIEATVVKLGVQTNDDCIKSFTNGVFCVCDRHSPGLADGLLDAGTSANENTLAPFDQGCSGLGTCQQLMRLINTSVIQPLHVMRGGFVRVVGDEPDRRTLALQLGYRLD